MVEKKVIVDGLRLSYNGSFDVIEFYKKVEDWIRENGLEKETKKKLEHVIPKGKKIEWFIECWKNVADYAKTVVRMRALLNNVREVEVMKEGSKIKLNQGDVLIILDAFLETDIEGRWQQKPWFFFLSSLFDKFIWRVKEKFDEPLRRETNDLHKTLTDFFNSYKA